MRKGVVLLSAALLSGVIPLMAQTTETTSTPETTKTIWYDSITGARHFKIEQATNNDGVQKKTVQHVIMRSGSTVDPASVVISDSVSMEDVVIQADDGGKNVVRLRRMVAPNAAAVTWTMDSTALIQDVLLNRDDADILQFTTEGTPQIMMMDMNTEGGNNEVFFHQSVPPVGMEGMPQIMTIDIREKEDGQEQGIVQEPSQFQVFDMQNAENVKIEGGAEKDLEVQINKLMEELKARDGELKKVLEQTTPESGKVRKEIRIVRRSLDSAQMLMEVARGQIAKLDGANATCKSVCVARAMKCDSAMVSRMREEELAIVAPNAPTSTSTRLVVRTAPVAPVPPLPPDADIFIKAFRHPQMVMLSGDSVSIVEEKDGERVVRVFELGNRDTTLVINETDRDGARRTITVFNGPLTMMNAGNTNLRVICMKGDSIVANVDQKVIVIGPRYAQAKEMLEEVKRGQNESNVVAKAATPNRTAGYMLHDAMPNPTSGSVTVNFTLPEAGQAKLELYDANGTVVKKMADGDHAAGDHAVSFDTSDLASGTYFYRLTSGDFVQSKALQVVK